MKNNLMQKYPDPTERTYINSEGKTLKAAFGRSGEVVLEKLGYKPQGGSMTTEQAPKKRKVHGLSNEDKAGIAAKIQRDLKEKMPDLSINDLCKIASTFYTSTLKQKKSQQ